MRLCSRIPNGSRKPDQHTNLRNSKYKRIIEMTWIKPILISAVLWLIALDSFAQQKNITPFEKSEGHATSTYFECIEYYKTLADQNRLIQIEEIGQTDSGYPLHVVTFNHDGRMESPSKNKIKILILNAIHPGEPAGVDASMMLVRDLASGKILDEISGTISLAIIPFYNVGGGLLRGSFSRANQNGPEAYGFRGNAKNLDLNRDFIKMDAKNTISFVEYFHSFDPEIFVDTHTSNGADYQYIMTCLDTHPQKMGGKLGQFMKEKFTPSLFESMKKKGYEMCPFVNVYGKTPDKGYSQFFDYPRFSTGYAALFQTIGFMSEAHMLKSFKERVQATYQFLISVLENGVTNTDVIRSIREMDRVNIMEADKYVLGWDQDHAESDTILFKGYQASTIDSKVTGGKRLKYDHEHPYEIKIPYYSKLLVNKSITVPKAYVISQAWDKVIKHLEVNNISFSRYPADTLLTVETYYIEDFKTYQSPYEGHYPHYGTILKPVKMQVKVKKGDYYVPVGQRGMRYIIESLEPEGEDSFFKWNFFDPVLQQKEHFSAYVFEDTAERILNAKPWLRDSLTEKVKIDKDFGNNSRAQLDYIYRNSEFFEKSYRLYPVFRILQSN